MSEFLCVSVIYMCMCVYEYVYVCVCARACVCNGREEQCIPAAPFAATSVSSMLRTV